jgi:hypothetical protein
VHPLDSARAKLRRADEHLDALKAEAAAWLDSRPYDLYWDPPYPELIETPHLELDIHVGVVREPPEALGVILGDVLHNLRGALDNLFWALVTRTGMPTPAEARTISFPIARRYATFLQQAGIRSFHKRAKGAPRASVLPDPPGRNRVTYAERLTIQRHQPYHREDPANHPLAILRDLNDRDKHRAFHPVLITAEEPGPRFFITDGQIIFQEWRVGEPLIEGAHVADIWIGERGLNLDVEVDFVPLAVAFGDATHSVPLRDLDAVREAVAAVLAEFVWAFPATTL